MYEITEYATTTLFVGLCHCQSFWTNHWQSSCVLVGVAQTFYGSSLCSKWLGANKIRVLSRDLTPTEVSKRLSSPILITERWADPVYRQPSRR